MDNRGWIKIHRKIEENAIFSSEWGLKIWIWCLLRAGHSENDVYFGLTKIHLKRGQFIFGRESASKQLHIKPSTLRNWMEQLKMDSYIDIKPTNKYSIVTVLNWSKYQDNEQQKGQQSDNRVTTDGQQSDTNNKDNNVNNENNDKKKIQIFSSKGDITLPVMNEIAEKYHVPLSFVQSKFDDMSNWMAAKGKVYRNYKAALSNWVKSDALKIMEKERQTTNKFHVTKL